MFVNHWSFSSWHIISLYHQKNKNKKMSYIIWKQNKEIYRITTKHTALPVQFRSSLNVSISRRNVVHTIYLCIKKVPHHMLDNKWTLISSWETLVLSLNESLILSKCCFIYISDILRQFIELLKMKVI